MKQKIILLLFITATVSADGYSQGSRTRKYVVAPAQMIFLTVAAQPECPLKIENAQMLLSIDGGPTSYTYRLVNRGRKPIHYFTVSAWPSGTLMNPAPWDGRITKQLLMPGRSVPGTGKIDPDMEIVPLTNELRKKLKLDGTMKSIVILMVDQIRYADGSVYDNRPALEALSAYFEKVAP
jgi:hypothetical protein